jgi:hypothetical protein
MISLLLADGTGPLYCEHCRDDLDGASHNGQTGKYAAMSIRPRVRLLYRA